MSLQALKPRFQDLLRPAVAQLARQGVTANQVTLFACVVSVAVGLGVGWAGPGSPAYLAIPVWMLLRMALNAVDGMLAREFGQRSVLGGYLNELTDLVSDAALYLPFAWLTPWGLGTLVWLAAVCEMAGVLGAVAGATRRYDGPCGKSDRAFAFGALGLWIAACGEPLPAAAWCVWALVGLTAWTTVQRVRRGLSEIRSMQKGTP
jgi:CDP-diacylglycerol--glycerol-3-phosphate 3-phosphatidyltransferase